MMPIYEYECEKCGCCFELRRRFGEDEGSPCCLQCRGKVRRLFSPPAIIFKGSGFYVTDSRNDHNHPSGDGKADKVESRREEEGKADKVKSERKEEGKTDKVKSERKEEGKTDKVESRREEEDKADKIESGKKSESK